MGVLVALNATPFAAAIRAVDDAIAARVCGCSWRDDPRCPALDALAYVTARHRTLDGGVADGELIVARPLAAAVVTLLHRLYGIGFPIAGMRLVDDHGADDDASMEADNSSAFNFRTIAGSTTLSQHAFGRAIDLNPRENPMVWPPDGARFVPPNAAAFLDRRVLRPGMIVRPGPVTAIFDELGWIWGGDWMHVADLHHITRAPARVFP